MIRRFPNGGTPSGKTGGLPAEFIGGVEATQGSEPSQYLEEKKTIAISGVVASEMETAQTVRSDTGGVVGPHLAPRRLVERLGKVGQRG